MKMCEYRLSDGFLDVFVGEDSSKVSELLMKKAVGLCRLAKADDLFRCARMSWEMLHDGWVTDIDRTDVGLLLSLPLDGESGTERLHNTLNSVKNAVVKSLEVSPRTEHSAAMSVVRSMCS